MINKFPGSIIRGGNRVLLWTLALLLTASILAYPVSMVEEYHNIQAPYIINNLPIFIFLFLIWLTTLLMLVFTSQATNEFNWELLICACMFSIVFAGFWVIVTPFGSFGDDIYNVSHLKYLLEQMTIPVGHTKLQYFEFPGLHLLNLAIADCTGVDPLQCRNLFLLFNSMVLVSFIFISSSILLKSSRLAFFSTVLIFVSATLLILDLRVLYPRTIGYTFLIGFMYAFSRWSNTTRSARFPWMVTILLIYFAMAITYLPTSILAPLILASVYIVGLIAREKAIIPGLGIIVLFLIIISAWQIYWTWSTYRNLISFFPRIMQSLTTGEFLRVPLTLFLANTAEAVPLWATITKLVCWCIVVTSTFVGIVNVFRLHSLTRQEKIVTGGLLGIVILTVISVFGTDMGNQFFRFLLYAPFFSIPLLISWLFRDKIYSAAKNVAVYAVTSLLILPCFLSGVSMVATEAIYKYDLSAANFLYEIATDKGNNLILYTTTSVQTIWARYTVPNSAYYSSSLSGAYNKDTNWKDQENGIRQFHLFDNKSDSQKLFIQGNKGVNLIRHILGISPDAEGWKKLGKALELSNLIYSDRHTDMFSPIRSSTQ